MLTLLCAVGDREKFIDLIFRETTTLGVRHRNEKRVILRREFVTVETKFGAIKIKIARNENSEIINASPEFIDCQAAANTHQIAVREVQSAALKSYDEKS